MYSLEEWEKQDKARGEGEVQQDLTPAGQEI